ncbi:MAG TPA: ribosome-associated translation inhibitor RaiA [Terriglobia bacterium]|nr:ribosome-associated translation inhibitor RaiA [Terriglobia bacterium]
MQIEYTGRQIDITPDLRQYTEERLNKVTRLLRDRYSLHVILTAERHRRIAEITLKFRDHSVVGIDRTADARSSINGALDKIERQVVRLLERSRTRKRRPKPTSTVVLNLLAGARVDHHEHEVLETERIAIKPLAVDEAIESADLTRRGVVVFRNSETDRVNVMYRRADGKLALIEPVS